MATVTYYFNTYDAEGEAWDTDPENMSDGSIETFATTTDGADSHDLLSTNADADPNLGTIETVEYRVYGYGSTELDRLSCQPIYVGSGDGTAHEFQLTTSGAWTDYVDITEDDNALDWAWTDFAINVNMRLMAPDSSSENLTYVAKVELRVTYTSTARRRKSGRHYFSRDRNY